MNIRFSVAALAMSAGLLGGLVAAPAAAQAIRIGSTAIGGSGGTGSDNISKGALARYSRTLKLDASQKEAAETLHATYAEVVARFDKEASEKMAAMQEDGDAASMREMLKKMPEIMRNSGEGKGAATKQFLDDLKSLLTRDQESLWPMLERQRRREGGMGRASGPMGGVSGSGVDLVMVVDSVKLPPAEFEKVRGSLETYEADVDRVLAEQQRDDEAFRKAQAEKSGKSDNGVTVVTNFDMESFKAMREKNQAHGMAMREVNQKYIRQMGGALSDEWKTKLEEAYRRKAMPQVFKDSPATKSLAAAAKFTDLTAEQQKVVTELQARYAEQAGPMNVRWASELEKAEAEGKADGMGMFGMGDENENEGLTTARKARRELDKEFVGKLTAALTDQQKAKLPKKSTPGSMFQAGGKEGGGGGAGMVIRINDGGGDDEDGD